MIGLLRLRLFMVVMQEPLRVVLVMGFLVFVVVVPEIKQELCQKYKTLCFQWLLIIRGSGARPETTGFVTVGTRMRYRGLVPVTLRSRCPRRRDGAECPGAGAVPTGTCG